MTLEQLKATIKKRIDHIDEPKLLYAIETVISHIHEEKNTELENLEKKDPQIYGDAIHPATSDTSSHFGKKGKFGGQEAA